MSKKSDKPIYYSPANSPVVPDRFDVRIRLRSLTRGLLTHDDVNKYRTNLPDDANNAEFRPFAEIIGQDNSGGEAVPPANGKH
jgi:hypothetical protein